MAEQEYWETIYISPTAIAGAKDRLGSRAGTVNWIVADITRFELPEHRFGFWHDRAVFHFLREPEARRNEGPSATLRAAASAV